MNYLVDKDGKLIITILRDTSDLDFVLKDGNIVVYDEVTQELTDDV